MKKFLVFLIVGVVLMAGCVQDKPVPVVQIVDKTFCWQVKLVNPYGYIYYNLCEKSEVIVGEIDGAKILYRDNLIDRRRDLRIKERKELF